MALLERYGAVGLALTLSAGQLGVDCRAFTVSDAVVRLLWILVIMQRVILGRCSCRNRLLLLPLARLSVLGMLHLDRIVEGARV